MITLTAFSDFIWRCHWSGPRRIPMWRYCLLLVKKLRRTCVCGMNGTEVRGRDRANSLKNGAVDLQHGSGMEGSLHSCRKGHSSQIRVLLFEGPHIYLLYIAQHYLKGTVAPVWVWLQVIWLERAKTGEELLSILKIFHIFFDFL